MAKQQQGGSYVIGEDGKSVRKSFTQERLIDKPLEEMNKPAAKDEPEAMAEPADKPASVKRSK